MCESRHLESESGSKSRHLESKFRRIRIHLYFRLFEAFLNPNPAKKGLNPDSNPNPDSDSHITGKCMVDVEGHFSFAFLQKLPGTKQNLSPFDYNLKEIQLHRLTWLIRQYLIFDLGAREIMYLVASVRPSVRPLTTTGKNNKSDVG